MNTRDLEMLDAWRHGRLSEDEFAEMQDRLRAEPELRAALRSLAEVEEGLSAPAIARANSPAPTPRPKEVSLWSNWLPWGIAAAALLVVAAAYGSRCVGHPGSPERTQNRAWRFARLCTGAGRTGGKCVCPRASGEAVGACRVD